MSDNLVPLLTEFRYWRASVPVGLAMGIYAFLASLSRWPELGVHGLVFSEPVNTLASSVGAPVLWVLALVAMLLLGGWWCDFAMLVLAHVQALAARFLPLAGRTSQWSWWQRRICPVRLSDVAALQASMERVNEYRDLPPTDRQRAYWTCLREVFTEPQTVLGRSDRTPEIVRGLTEVRAVVGLLPWLPLALVASAGHVNPPFSSLAWSLQAGAGLAAVLLVFGAWLQARSVSGHLVSALADDAGRLGRHARFAVDSGRNKDELTAANDSIA